MAILKKQLLILNGLKRWDDLRTLSRTLQVSKTMISKLVAIRNNQQWIEQKEIIFKRKTKMHEIFATQQQSKVYSKYLAAPNWMQSWFSGSYKFLFEHDGLKIKRKNKFLKQPWPRTESPNVFTNSKLLVIIFSVLIKLVKNNSDKLLTFG